MNPTSPNSTQTPPLNQPPKLPPLTLGQKIKYTLVAVFIVFAIGGWISWLVSTNAADADLKENGVRVTGTANGDYYEFTQRSRRSSSVQYKAKYDYTTIDGLESSAIGEKVYDTPEEVAALKGKNADVYYMPEDAGKGTYVENEP